MSLWTTPGRDFMPVWTPHPDPEAQARLAAVLAPWDGTRYMAGQQRRGAGVDCVRFVSAVLDELLGQQTPISTLPPDTAIHAPAKAEAAFQRLCVLFPVEPLEGAFVEPGDVLVTGPIHGGPGHAVVVGPAPHMLWHASHRRVHQVSIRGIALLEHRFFHAYRLRGDRRWR